MTVKKIALLGSTGSIGENSLDVFRQNPNHFKVNYLSAHSSVDKLISQAREFKPKAVVLTGRAGLNKLKSELNGICQVYSGRDALFDIVQDDENDLVLNALVGGAGVKPTFSAISAGKDVALANKETLVVAGDLITREAGENKVNIFPIDSEHSAIWQCLLGEDDKAVNKIILTASGGPFRTWPKTKLKNVTVEQALEHPNWQMGAKITIDSATLMNKGLEVIEAFWLYPVELSQIEIVVHPQSIIHSMVEFVDGSIKAQLGVPDMRIPIQYALTYPKRIHLQTERLSFEQIKSLTFEKPNYNKFPCLSLAFEALSNGGTMPAAMNFANEVAVNRFLKRQIGFTEIPSIIKKVMQQHPFKEDYDLQILEETEQWVYDFLEFKI